MAIGARRAVYILVKYTLTVINPTTLPYSISTATSSMFSPICGHVTPLHGGTRVQFGEASFQPGYPVIRCQHCKQLTPVTNTELPRPVPYVAVDPQLPSAHSTTYPPISRTAVSSTNTAAQVNSFGDFKFASFGNALKYQRSMVFGSHMGALVK